MSDKTQPAHSWATDDSTTVHCVLLTNGEKLLITEDKSRNRLDIALGDRDQNFSEGELPDDSGFGFDSNICSITPNGVMVLPNSGCATEVISRFGETDK